jgi:hypothetical protein
MGVDKPKLGIFVMQTWEYDMSGSVALLKQFGIAVHAVPATSFH